MGCFDSAGSKESSQSYTGGQAATLQQMLDVYGPSIGQGQNIYGGERLAPMGGTQTAALEQGGQYLDMFAPGGQIPLYGETGDALRGTLAGTTGAQQITPQQTSDYFQRAIQAPSDYRWQDTDKPLLEEQYAGPGYWGSARAGAVTKAGQERSNWLGEQRAGLEWDTLGRNQQTQENIANRQLAATPQAMQYGQQPQQQNLQNLAATQSIYGFAGAEQQQKQAEINVAMEQFAEQFREIDPEIFDRLMSLLGLSYSSGSARSWGEGLAYGALAGAAQGAGQGAGAAGMSAAIAAM